MIRESNLKDLLQVCGFVLVIGFSLNLVWENAQAPLYKGYNGFSGHFWVCLVASVVDALVLLLVYTLFAVFNRRLNWPLHVKPWQYGLLALVGGLLAVWFERWALARGQWSYTDDMPIVPVLEVGLLPLRQLLLLPGPAFYVSATTAKPHRSKRE